MTPLFVRGSDFTAARPFKQPEPASIEGRPVEDGSPVSGDSANVLVYGAY